MSSLARGVFRCLPRQPVERQSLQAEPLPRHLLMDAQRLSKDLQVVAWERLPLEVEHLCFGHIRRTLLRCGFSVSTLDFRMRI